MIHGQLSAIAPRYFLRKTNKPIAEGLGFSSLCKRILQVFPITMFFKDIISLSREVVKQNNGIKDCKLASRCSESLVISINSHLHRQSPQMRRDRICSHLLSRTCFGIPPNEDAKHEEKHLGFPLPATHQP